MKEIFEKAEEIKQIELEQIETTKQLKLFFMNKDIIEYNILNIEKEIAQLENNQKNTFMNNFMKTIHIGKNYKIQQQIEEKNKEIEKLKKDLNSIEINIKELQEKISKFLTILNDSYIQKIFKYEEEIIITDNYWEDLLMLKKYNDISEIKNIEEMPDSKKFLIHCTDFFPKNQTILSNYDGEKRIKTKLNYRGIEKEVSFLSHRHEVHFTINARVRNTGAGEGNWDKAHYIIIDRYDIHKDEMENIVSSDSWTKGTSFKLSNDSIIMVRIQDKGNLPITNDELSQYNIVYYDGDPRNCLENLLRISGYEVFETDANYAGHYHSTRNKQEVATENRDKVINFWKDNAYDGKETILLSESDILLLLDIAMSTKNISSFVFNIINNNMEVIKEMLGYKINSVKNLDLFQYVAVFLVGAGIKLDNNGMYTIKIDEEILADLEKLENTPEKLNEIIDVELIYKFYKKYEELKKILDNMTTDQIRMLIDKNILSSNEFQIETIEEEIIKKSK